MKLAKILDKIFEYVTPVLYLLTGLYVLIYAGTENSYEHILLGLVLVVTGFATIINYIGSKKYKNPHAHDIAIGIVAMCLGFIFLFAEEDALAIEEICVYWGIFEIVKGALEFEEGIKEVKEKHFLAIADIVLAIVGIVFGVLLAVHLSKGIEAHLIVLGIVFLITAVIQTIKLIYSRVKKVELD